jgi:two-component system OmpR family sensor kinase
MIPWTRTILRTTTEATPATTRDGRAPSPPVIIPIAFLALTSSPSDEHARQAPGIRRSASVRVRILGWYVALLGVSLVAALFLQRALLLRQATSDAQDALDQEVAELRQLAGGVNPGTGEPFGNDVAAIFDGFFDRNVPMEGEAVVTFIDGEIYKTDVLGNQIAQLPGLPAWAEVVEGRRGEFSAPEFGDVVYVAVPVVGDGTFGDTFVVTMLLRPFMEDINEAVRFGVIVFGSVFVLASAVAWVAAGRILRPLSDLRETAQSITESDLSRRIHVEGDDEIADLSRTFNSMLDRLDDAFASQRQFVDDASHELRTPITVIRGNLEVMGDDPQERSATVALVTDELDRMTRIVNDLLDLAKVEQPDFVQPEPIDLAEFTAELAVKAAALDNRPWLVETTDFVVIEADRHRLTQAMMNLLQNAADYSPPGTPVYIGGRLRWGSVKLWVRDEGVPITEGDRKGIFGRFSRIESGPRNTEGAGLGLAIVSAIAWAHGGSVSVDVGEEGGNIFTITIPAEPPGHRP